jgi:ribosomal protein S18 acetylase RimI-like enzyme
MQAVATRRAFETEILGIATFGLEIEGHADAAAIAKTLDAAKRAGARLLTCRRPETDRATIAALQACGFKVIECLLTLSRPLDINARSLPSGIRLSRKDDADGVATVGASIFRFDRFHMDPQVPKAAADRLKGAWARNSVEGRADAVFIAETDGRITGFNACLLRGDTAVIDLIGVRSGMQGRGIGRDLVAAALSHYAGRAARMIVGTQSANYASLALYHQAGFRIDNSAFTLHAHLD